MSGFIQGTKFKKQKQSLDPNNKFWANDKDRFGYKMLEKMGWEDGKGLGAKLEGETEFIKIDKRPDNRGIGAENKGAAWVNGLRDYDALLARMNQMSQNAQAKKPAEDLSSSSSESDSEEEKKDKKKKKSSKKDKESKKSKKSSKKGKKQSSTSSSDEEDEAKKDTEVEVPVENKRVIPRHFIPNRVMRAKTVRGYGSGDISAILGVKDASFTVLEKKTEVVAIVEVKEEKPVQDEKPKTEESNYGIQTVNSGATVADYFAQKMAALKAKAANGTSAPVATCVEIPPVATFVEDEKANSDNDIEEKKKDKRSKKDKKDKKRKREGDSEEQQVETAAKKSKKDKKEKRSKKDKSD